MRSAQRSQARSIFVLLVAIGAAPAAAAAETPQAPHASFPADNCTSSIASFSINRSEVAASETVRATLGVVKGGRFFDYTHYYEVVLLDDEGDEVLG